MTAPHAPTHPCPPAGDEALAWELDAELNPGARRTRQRPAFYGEQAGGEGSKEEAEWEDDGEVRAQGARVAGWGTASAGCGMRGERRVLCAMPAAARHSLTHALCCWPLAAGGERGE